MTEAFTEEENISIELVNQLGSLVGEHHHGHHDHGHGHGHGHDKHHVVLD